MNNIDCRSELKRSSRDVEVPETCGQSFCQGRHSIKLGDRFRLDGHRLSYANFHSEMISNVDKGPEKSKGFQPKQPVQSKADEVIRYMSNLPSYLERGEQHKDKTFNVGVLEWGRLEKWQYNQRQVPHQSCRSSPSSSNVSSFSSTEGSSSYSSRGHSCSPARQRPHQSMIDSNLNVSPSKLYSRAIKTSEKNGLKSHDLVDIPSNYLKLQQSILRTHQCFSKYTENKPKECKSNDSDLRSTSDKRRLQGPENQCVASSLKGKLKVQDGEVLKGMDNLQGPLDDPADPQNMDGQQTVIILLAKDKQEVRHSAYTKKFDSAGKCDREAIESSRRSFVDESNCKFDELYSGTPRTCPLSCEAYAVGQPQNQTERPSLVGTKSIKFPSEPSQSIPYSGRLSVSPVRGKKLEERKPTKRLNSSADLPKPKFDIVKSNSKANELPSHMPCSFLLSGEADGVCQRQNQTEKPSSIAKSLKFPPEVSSSVSHSVRSPTSPVRSKNLDERKSTKILNSFAEVPKPRMDVVQDGKSRHPSPIRRLSFTVGKLGRNSISKDSCTPRSIHPANEIDAWGAETSVLSVDSSCDKSNAASKGRSSPLRRLLDPLLKPRAGNCDISSDSKHRASAQIDRGCKSGGRGEASALHSMKVKLDLGSCKSIDIDHPQGTGKCESTVVQALLQLTVKNGLPLFTFAVDNSSDILAATMKKLSSGRKDGNKLMYTFFVIHEMKKKSGNWLSQGSKEKNHDYISDIVGQMKVSDVPNTVLSRQNSVDRCSIREFVLLATNTKQADQHQTSDLQANDELAAIVVKLPKMTVKPLNGSGSKKCYTRKFSTEDLKESPREDCGPSDCRDTEGSESSSREVLLSGLTVILPGADHGVPSKGKPSPLLERWRLGGSCDCGGWDMGCRLRVIQSEGPLNRGSGSNKSHSTTGKIQLYSQEQVPDRKPIFSLSPFKDGIYSVEFDSSLKLLQAFSVCIAVLNGLKPTEFSELSRFFEKKSAEETTSAAIDDGAKVSNRDPEEIPASFVARPPGSPVARV